MKFQLATIEAIASIILITFSLGILYRGLNNAYAGLSVGREFFLENIAAYDFIDQAYKNASLGSCLNYSIEGNGTCIEAYLSKYSEAYGLNLIELSINKTYSYGNISITKQGVKRCFYYNEAIACLYLVG